MMEGASCRTNGADVRINELTYSNVVRLLKNFSIVPNFHILPLRHDEAYKQHLEHG